MGQPLVVARVAPVVMVMGVGVAAAVLVAAAAMVAMVAFSHPVEGPNS
jgi:hypothetical protein